MERQKNAVNYINELSNHKHFLIQRNFQKQLVWLHLIRNNSLFQEELIKKLKNNGIESRPIVTGNFTKSEVIKYLDYEIHDSLINADYLDENGYFGNQHYPINEVFKILGDII